MKSHLHRSIRAAVFSLALLGSGLPALESVPFVRGDADSSGNVNLSDGVFILLYLFGGQASPTCHQAADLDADGILDVSDAIAVLSFLFLGQRAPLAPYPECGYVEGPESQLSCDSHEPCEHHALERLRGETDDAWDLGGFHDFETVLLAPQSADGTEVATVTSELFWALKLLAPGESILALRGVPGFLEYVERSRALAEVRNEPRFLEEYVPTVTVSRGASNGPPCFEFSGEVLAELTHVLAEAAILEGGSTIVGAEPEQVCERGVTPVLLLEERSDGRRQLRSCNVELLTGELAGSPTKIEVRMNVGLKDDTSGNSPTRCEWIVTVRKAPVNQSDESEARTYDILGQVVLTDGGDPNAARGPNHGGDGWSYRNGDGPVHDFLAIREVANCFSPKTEISLSGDGDLSADIDVRCYHSSGVKVAPDECQSSVESVAWYSSVVRIHTQDGISCQPMAVNAIEAVAQDEATYSVNGFAVFNKAVAVQNGTDLAATVSFEFGADTDRGPERGVAGDPTAEQGFSLSRAEEVGIQEDLLECRGNDTSTSMPVALLFRSKGSVLLRGSRSTVGLSRVRTRLCAFYFVGTSTCPGAGTTVSAWIAGETSLVGAAREEANCFFKLYGDVDSLRWIKQDKM